MLKKTGLFFFSAVLALALFPFKLGYSQQSTAEYEQRLQEISSRISELRAKIQAENKRESSVLSRLGKLGLEKNLIKNELNMFNTQRERAASEQTAIQKKVQLLLQKLEQEKESVATILVTLYKFGRINYYDMVLQTENVADLISEHKHLTSLAQHEQQIIQGHKQTLAELKKSEDQLTAKKTEIEDLISQSRGKQQELRLQEQKQRNLINEINQNREMFNRTLEEQKERAEQLQLLIKKLIQDKVNLPFPVEPLYEKKGDLPWPLTGRVVTRFGNIRHPRYNTMINSKGIEISSEENVIVRSIHPGVVVYTDYLPGVGNLVFIDHGMSYYSLYGHCSDFLVKKGSVVTTGQPIAYVGDIGSMKGNTLHFEIRNKTTPLNPLQWLKRR